MSKFGKLVASEIPILIDFYSDIENDTSTTLNEVASALGNRARVIKIDVEKNELLAKALQIKYNPTFIIYKESEMKWRQSGQQNANALIEMLEQFA